MLLVIGIWAGIGWISGVVTAEEFEGGVRDIIRLNPRMKDDEFHMRLQTEANEHAVQVTPTDVVIERGGSSILGGGITEVHLRYRSPMKVTLFSWRRSHRATVLP